MSIWRRARDAFEHLLSAANAAASLEVSHWCCGIGTMPAEALRCTDEQPGLGSNQCCASDDSEAEP